MDVSADLKSITANLDYVQQTQDRSKAWELLNWLQQGGFEQLKILLQEYLTPIVGPQALPPKRKMHKITVRHSQYEEPEWELNLPANATLAEVKAAINAQTEVDADNLTDFSYILRSVDYPLTGTLPEGADRITFTNKEYAIPVQYKGQIFNVGVDYDMEENLFVTRIAEDLNLPSTNWIHVFMGLKELGNSGNKILDLWRANPGVPVENICTLRCIYFQTEVKA